MAVSMKSSPVILATSLPHLEEIRGDEVYLTSNFIRLPRRACFTPLHLLRRPHPAVPSAFLILFALGAPVLVIGDTFAVISRVATAKNV